MPNSHLVAPGRAPEHGAQPESPRDGGAGADGNWEVTPGIAADWAGVTAACGAGFFHTPAALGVSLGAGAPVSAVLRRGADVVAAAFGVSRGCRLSRAPRHYEFAAPPAVARAADATAAVRSFTTALARRGAAEAVLGSFDAPANDTALDAFALGGARLEYRVTLPRDGDTALLTSFGSTHRRNVSRGERERWELRTLTGVTGRDSLFAVQTEAAERATRRNDVLEYEAVPADAFGDTPLTAPWGTRCFAAYADNVLLTVALVGWGGTRAFYVSGGSTPEGYRAKSAVWTHWRIMTECARAGHTVYNFGGVPAAAEREDHPAHGLLRFKTGFGAEPTRCQNLVFTFRPLHQHAHRALDAAVGLVRRARGGAAR